MSDLIDRQKMLKHIEKKRQGALMMDDMRIASIIMTGMDLLEEAVRNQPSAQTDTSRIENILHGKSAEEQYDFLWWLMQDYGMQFTDTRSAVIEWLRGERNG